MSEHKHTPGPWIASVFGTQVLTGDEWNTICTLTPIGHDYRSAQWEDGRGASHKDANAFRIVACVDVCEGLSTEALEAGVVGELVEALEALTLAMHEYEADASEVPTWEHRALMRRAQSALAKARGEVSS